MGDVSGCLLLLLFSEFEANVVLAGVCFREQQPLVV